MNSHVAAALLPNLHVYACSRCSFHGGDCVLESVIQPISMVPRSPPLLSSMLRMQICCQTVDSALLSSWTPASPALPHNNCIPCLVGWLEFNVPFQHKHGYIRDDRIPLCCLLILHSHWQLGKGKGSLICIALNYELLICEALRYGTC